LRAKLEKNLGSISDMTRLPGALFIVDIRREHIAVKEAQKLNIPIFAMVDTNADPRDVDYVIPANDDASKSIEKIMTLVTEAVAEGLKERQKDKAAKSTEADKPAEVTTEEVVEEAKVEEVAEEAASADEDKPAKADKPAKKKKAAKKEAAPAKADKPAEKADKPAEVKEEK
jgi:small subunit ribosomal protein S2